MDTEMQNDEQEQPEAEDEPAKTVQLEPSEPASRMTHTEKFLAELGKQKKTVATRNAGNTQPAKPRIGIMGPDGEIPREIPVRLGRYLIDGLIGRGGMGVVYKARQEGLNRPVALKLLLQGEHATPEGKKRFDREARAIAKLRHPNIVTVHEIGDYNGQPFFTMDFIDGLPLNKFVKKVPIEPEVIADLCIRIAEAVHYAHEQGVIHRDIKPENILMTAQGEPILTDFGLAKDMDSMSILSMSGEVMGTPAFMSPEQAAGKTLETDRRSDVYALGAILYWLLTHHEPFEGKSMVETLTRVATEDPPLVTKFNASIHPDLCAICLKAMEKDKKQRYDTAEEFADDLRRYLKGYPVRAQPWSWRRAVRRFVARHKWAVASAVAALLAIIVVGILSATIFARTYLEIAARRLISPDPLVRAAALKDLGREAVKPEELKPQDVPKALTLLAGMCKDTDDHVVAAWVDFLAEHGDNPGVADVIGTVGKPSPVGCLTALAGSDKPALRNSAITAIGKIRRAEFADYLIGRLKEPNPSIRMLIIRSLAAQHSTKALGPLINIVTTDPICRAEAKAALDRLYQEGRVAFFDSQDRAVKNALHSLSDTMATYSDQMESAMDDGSGEAPPTGPFAQSEKALTSRDPQTRIKAVYELGLTGDKRAAPLLMNALNDTDTDVGSAAAMAVSRLDPEGLLDTLRKNVSADSPALRGNSALALGFLKKKEDLDPMLVALAGEKDLGAKKKIIHGLSEMGLAAAIPGLRGAAASDPRVKAEVDIAVIRLK